MTSSIDTAVPTNDPATWLRLNAEEATAEISATLRTQVGETLKRRGVVVAMSGGVDSSVCAGLAVRAFGPKRVFGLFLPERDSDPLSLSLATEWASKLGIEYTLEDITPILDGAGCYRRRDEAIKRVVPEFDEAWKSKIVLGGNRLESDRLNVSYLVVQRPGSQEFERHRLPPEEYRQIVAASNFKQRTRKMLEYYHADRLHYAVVGTPNRLEYDQGFFVKGGDGLADVKPIAHLFKTQVYQLAEYLGVPTRITSRPPTTDTYSLPQSQEEFYFSLPAKMMDLVLYAHNAGFETQSAAAQLGLTAEQVRRAYLDIEQKRSTTRYLHLGPQLIESVNQLHLDTPRSRG
jgi:NAD+ synthase